ncbi:PAS domain-containing sensor histidine kinase [uncultured Phocaeicola sp.]|uniref:sensor histidine kinase n=1 Tax=uncultured Phocaeicola sp. TaxID=990718 RepID=UPI0025CED1CC|nr:PAS domain-containing sensor histidine kinase [uncultured Phocaeicola sp.]
MKKNFSYCLLNHILALVACITAGIYSLLHGLLFSGFACTLISVGICISLYRIQRRTVENLKKTIACLQRNDLSGIVPPAFNDKEIRELSAELTEVIRKLKENLVNEEAKYQYYENLLNNVDTAVIVCNGDGRIDWMNKTSLRLLDDTAKIPPEVMEAVRQNSQVVRLHGNTSDLELAVSSAQITIKGKERNIVTLKNIHSALEKTEMEAWQKLIRVLTHEIMNSITPIISLSDTLSERSREYPQSEHTRTSISQGLDIIHRRCKGLMEFVENYRKLTRISPPVKTCIEVDAFFDDLKGLVAETYIRFRIAQKGMTWNADRPQMEQVFLNLLKNAREACSKQPQPEVEVCAEPLANGIRFTVSDNGEGILPEVKERIFVPFFTTKPNGSGIGLSLCRQIVSLHGGRIYVESAPGKGSRFIVEF